MLDGPAEAEVAVLDPPWYPEDTLAFLRVASRALRPDSLVLLAQPGRLTRPGVEPERCTILEDAGKFGYSLIHTLPDYVRYEMPHFEFVTLRRKAWLSESPRIGVQVTFSSSATRIPARCHPLRI